MVGAKRKILVITLSRMLDNDIPALNDLLFYRTILATQEIFKNVLYNFKGCLHHNFEGLGA